MSHRRLANLGVVGLLALQPGCEVDTRVYTTSLTVHANPAIACRGETINVGWTATSEFRRSECMDSGAPAAGYGNPHYWGCPFVELTSVPPLVEVSSRLAFNYSQSTGLPQTTTFVGTLRARSETNREEFTREHNVTATVVETAEYEDPHVLRGGCSGATPSWQELDLRSRLSSCVAVRGVCNDSSPDSVRVSDTDEPGTFETLAPGRCTERFNGPGRRLNVRNLSLVPGVIYCGETSTGGPPRSVTLRVNVVCDTGMLGCRR